MSIISLSRTKGQVYSGPFEAISATNIAFIHRGQLTLDNHMDLLQQLEMNIPSPPHSTPSARTEVLFLQGRTSCLPLHPLYPGPAVSFRMTSPLGATSAAKACPASGGPYPDRPVHSGWQDTQTLCGVSQTSHRPGLCPTFPSAQPYSLPHWCPET